MKTIFKRVTSSMLTLSVVIFLSSCGGKDEDSSPANTIDDSSGIKVDLDWTTGGSVNDALVEADLDLWIYKNQTKVLDSSHGGSFERIEFDPDLYADGTYNVVVYLYSNSKQVNYNVTVNGVTVSKPITTSSTFAAEEESHEVDLITIVKSGSKYTISD
jgi:hypothetical protein